MIASSVGESLAVFVRNPFELIKQNLQVDNHKNIASAFRSIIKNEGLTVNYNKFLIFYNILIGNV